MTGRPVATLGQPDASGMLSKVAFMRCYGCSNLCAHALIGSQQRHIAVGSAACKQLDQSFFGESAETLYDLAVERTECIKRAREVAAPVARGFCQVHGAGLHEVRFIFTGGDDLAVDVLWV